MKCTCLCMHMCYHMVVYSISRSIIRVMSVGNFSQYSISRSIVTVLNHVAGLSSQYSISRSIITVLNHVAGQLSQYSIMQQVCHHSTRSCGGSIITVLIYYIITVFDHVAGLSSQYSLLNQQVYHHSTRSVMPMGNVYMALCECTCAPHDSVLADLSWQYSISRFMYMALMHVFYHMTMYSYITVCTLLCMVHHHRIVSAWKTVQWMHAYDLVPP